MNIDNDINKNEFKEKTRIFLKRLKKLSDKFSSLGVKRKSVLSAANDICELYDDAAELITLVDSLLTVPSNDWDKLQDIFVDFDVCLWHMKDHLVHSRKASQYLAEYCDKFIDQLEE